MSTKEEKTAELDKLIDMGKNMLSNIEDLAVGLEHPQGYDSFTKLLKEVASLTKQKHSLDEPKTTPQGQIEANADGPEIIEVTSADLIEMTKDN